METIKVDRKDPDSAIPNIVRVLIEHEKMLEVLEKRVKELENG